MDVVVIGLVRKAVATGGPRVRLRGNRRALEAVHRILCANIITKKLQYCNVTVA